MGREYVAAFLWARKAQYTWLSASGSLSDNAVYQAIRKMAPTKMAP